MENEENKHELKGVPYWGEGYSGVYGAFCEKLPYSKRPFPWLDIVCHLHDDKAHKIGELYGYEIYADLRDVVADTHDAQSFSIGVKYMRGKSKPFKCYTSRGVIKCTDKEGFE